MHYSELLSILAVPIALTDGGDSSPGKTSESSNTPAVTASFQLGEPGHKGLLSVTPSSWHSGQSPKLPESQAVNFQISREIKLLEVLQQEGQPARAPEMLRVAISNVVKAGSAAGGSDDACAQNTPDGWTDIDFEKQITPQYLRMVVFSNCGDPQLSALNG